MIHLLGVATIARAFPRGCVTYSGLLWRSHHYRTRLSSHTEPSTSNNSGDSRQDTEREKGPSRVRCRARIAYDGSNFAGFQIQGPGDNQKPKRTVQGELENVLSKRFGGQHVRVVAAGRTDAGVHARGQACHFDIHLNPTTNSTNETSPRIKRETLERMLYDDIDQVGLSIEKMLPEDLAFWNFQVAPKPQAKFIAGQWQRKEWNAMHDSEAKLYSYRIHVGPVMNPLQRHNRWHPDQVHQWFDRDKLERILKRFEGTHDFRAFAGAIEQLELSKRSFLLEEKKSDDLPEGNLVNTVRTVRSVNLVPEYHEDQYCYRIDFILEGALYKQVRNMVGSAVEVCKPRGQLSEEEFYNLFDANVTRGDNLSKPAPPQGLTLEKVFFGAEDHDF